MGAIRANPNLKNHQWYFVSNRGQRIAGRLNGGVLNRAINRPVYHEIDGNCEELVARLTEIHGVQPGLAIATDGGG